jgi:hypothetical protein
VRRAQRWTPAVHGLLAHLRSVGFDAAPEVLGADEAGNEVLRSIDGDSGADGWQQVVPEEGLRAFARLLRRFHDAVRDYQPTTTNWATERHALRLGEEGIEPQAGWVREGYLDEIRARVDWTYAHRSLFER